MSGFKAFDRMAFQGSGVLHGYQSHLLFEAHIQDQEPSKNKFHQEGNQINRIVKRWKFSLHPCPSSESFYHFVAKCLSKMPPHKGLSILGKSRGEGKRTVQLWVEACVRWIWLMDPELRRIHVASAQS